MFKAGDKLQTLLTVLVTWAVLVVLFFAYEMYFVNGQRKYLQERGFRALAALSAELAARFTQAQSSAQSSVRLVANDETSKAEASSGPTVDVPVEIPLQARCHEAKQTQTGLCGYLDLYLKDVWAASKSLEDGTAKCWGSNRDDIPLESILDTDRLILYISCLADRASVTTTDPSQATKTPIYTLNLEPWVQRSFDNLGGYFDDILVADSTGHVLFQLAQTGPRIMDLKALVLNGGNQLSTQKPLDSPDSNVKTNTPAKSGKEPSAGGSSAAGQRIEALEASAFTRVTLESESYELFTQPMRILLGSYPTGGTPRELVVGGLRRTDSLDKESHAVPYSTLIWLALIAVAIFSLTWPLMKLRLMNKTERFRPRDGWYLILAIFLASTSVMLLLLNASYTARARDGADGEMKQLAAQIKKHVREEISLDFVELQRIGTTLPRAPRFVPSYFHPDLKSQLMPDSCYPYFEIAFWVSGEGKQLQKVDVRPVATPPTDASAFAFFKDSLSDVSWLSKGDSHRDPLPCPKEGEDALRIPASAHVHLEPRFSPNTGEFLMVLAAPFNEETSHGVDRQIAVQVLATKPITLVDPVLPPGYEFAVVDSQCAVLFHSESFRNLKENFCQESKDPDDLQPWFHGGSDAPLNISYAGRPERAYVTELPLPGLPTGPAFLIVFQEPDRASTLNLAIVLVCSILMGAYSVILLLGAILHLLARRSRHWIYAPRFVWPCREHALIYVQLFAANGAMLLLFWLFYLRLYELSLLIATLSVAALSLIFLFWKLRFVPRTLFPVGNALTLVAILFGSVLFTPWLWVRLFPSVKGETPPELPLEWIILCTLLAIFGQIAVLLSESPSWLRRPIGRGLRMPEWIKQTAAKRFTLAYALAAVSVIACIAIVPCAGFFKYAYDSVTELSLKHDQLDLSHRLLQRVNRIRQYYEQLNAIDMAEGRRRETLDRYDRLFFSTVGDSGPALPRQVQFPDPTAEIATGQNARDPECPPKPVRPSSSWVSGHFLNDPIEKVIAHATLNLPANQLGSELGKLGVASTGGERDRPWEYYWNELTATHFELNWCTDSSTPNFQVSSSYAAWEGTGGWASLLESTLLILLVLWLLSLVKRIFLTDIPRAPDFRIVDWRVAGDIQTNFLLIGHAKSGKTDRLTEIVHPPAGEWQDLRVELKRIVEDENYEAPCCQAPILVLNHFDFNMNDRVYNRARLERLEDLLYGSTHKLVVVSSVDPLYFLTEGAPDVLSDSTDAEEAHRLLDRWARVLSKLTKVRLPDSSSESFEKQVDEFATRHPDCVSMTALLREECGPTQFLRQVGIGILDQYRGEAEADEWLMNTVLSCADSYYHVLWSGLTVSERLVLYQLALDGWVNPKNAPAIQQLERKGLIYRAPMYRVMNESFRRFVECAEHAGEIGKWEQSERQSTWRALRLVLTAVAIGTGIWLLHAQSQLLQAGVGYAAAIGTLLTAVTGLLSRSRGSAPPGANASVA